MGIQAMSGLFGYTKHFPVLKIYEDNAKKWRWDITEGTDIVAASSQGYASRQHCIDNIKRIGEHINYLGANNQIK
jgi:uncharacterized protein YegP (UPF0339 family)